MSEKGLANGIDGPSKRRIGTVVTVFDEDQITVRRDSDFKRQAQRYAAFYWEKLS